MVEEITITLSNGKIVKVIIDKSKIIAECCKKRVEIPLDDVPIIEAALTAYYRKMLIDAGKKL
ncbi:MAG: hypothetical protein DRN30_00865 [Thermoplasmata archaeon]|nr:hypothetical protein [Euryarchaeota archaeon]RLF67077.1 MAG: hypothetical protein DRN30_00865 [Thermoplasmata archaeon]